MRYTQMFKAILGRLYNAPQPSFKSPKNPAKNAGVPNAPAAQPQAWVFGVNADAHSPAPGPACGLPGLQAPTRLPRYVTHNVWYAGAVVCEAAVFTGCLVGSGLMLPAALFGASASGPLRYAKGRWKALQGLRAIAVEREHVAPERWRAFEALAVAEQKEIARSLGTTHAGFDDVDDALRWLVAVPAHVRVGLCDTARNLQTMFPPDFDAERFWACVCALPERDLERFVSAGEWVGAEHLAWLWQSRGPVFAGKVAWLAESSAAFRALSRYGRQYPEWDMAVDGLLQMQWRPSGESLLGACGAWGAFGRQFGDEPWIHEALLHVLQGALEQREGLGLLRSACMNMPVLMREIFELPPENRDDVIARLAQACRLYGGAPVSAARWPIGAQSCADAQVFWHAVVQNYAAHPPDLSCDEVSLWAMIPLRSEADANIALALRSAGMSVHGVAVCFTAYCELQEGERASVLARCVALREQQDWSEAEAFAFAHISLSDTQWARVAAQRLPYATALEAVRLSELAWQIACGSPNDLADTDWLAWLQAQDDAKLQQLCDAPLDGKSTIRRALLWPPALKQPLIAATAVALEACAPSLPWLWKMASIAYTPCLSRVWHALQAYSPKQQLEIIDAIRTVRNFDAHEPGITAAIGLLPELATSDCDEALQIFRAFCSGINYCESDLKKRVVRTLQTFGSLLGGWERVERFALLRAFEANNRPINEAQLTRNIRESVRDAEAVLQAIAWCSEPLSLATPVVKAENLWERERETIACIDALATSRPIDLFDSLLVDAAIKRGDRALASALVIFREDFADYEAYFVHIGGSLDHVPLAASLYPGVSEALAAAAVAWGGRGPLPIFLRTYFMSKIGVPEDERSHTNEQGTALRYIDAQGLHRLMEICDALTLPISLDRALRVAILDVLDPPRAVRAVRQAGCLTAYCDTPDDERHTVLDGCSCGQTMCDGCTQGALAAAPNAHTCRSGSACGAPLTREYLESLNISEGDAVARRALHYREKLRRVPGFELNERRTDTLSGRASRPPVYGPDDIPPLPDRIDAVAMRMLLRGLAYSPNPNGELVERECYHCGQPVQKDENCLHMGRQEGHMHGDWDFVRGHYDGTVRWARHGLRAQEYIPRVQGPLGRAHFYDGLPNGIMDTATRQRVGRRRTAWLAQLEPRERR